MRLLRQCGDRKLGRIIYEGDAIPNTGIPGAIAGVAKERVIHAECAGILYGEKKDFRLRAKRRSDRLHLSGCTGEGRFRAEEKEVYGAVAVKATISGILRGLIRDGYPVTKGFKIADIDPRESEYENCFTISDKARCIAGGVLEALLHAGILARVTGSKSHSHSDKLTVGKAVNGLQCYTLTMPQPLCRNQRRLAQAVKESFSYIGNAGRGANEASLFTSRLIFQTRKQIAELFHMEDGEQSSAAERVVFTMNATESLNIVLKGLLHPGDHVITTGMEHNSVLRPLYELEEKGVSVTIVACEKNGTISCEKIQQAIGKNTKAIVCTHASNVTGDGNDIAQIGTLCEKYNLYFILDASQTAGAGRDRHGAGSYFCNLFYRA